MGTVASAEPCVYERLWESIAVLRESGHRYGMSERDIERFITQVLQTNEPQEQEPDQDQEQPGFPLLRVIAQCSMFLCLLLLLLGLSSPQSHSGPLSLGLNWTCPLGAARLLDLPIAHKYNLREYRGLWRTSPLQPTPPPQTLENITVCRDQPKPLILKGGAVWSLQRSHLQQLLQANPNLFSVSVEKELQDLGLQDLGLQEQANFTVHWRSTGGAAESLLFPLAPPPPLALRRCVVKNLRPSLPELQTGVPVQGWLLLGEGQASLSVSPLCPPHHRSSRVQLSPGDRVFYDPRFWRTKLILVPDQTVFCVGAEF